MTMKKLMKKSMGIILEIMVIYGIVLETNSAAKELTALTQREI